MIRKYMGLGEDQNDIKPDDYQAQNQERSRVESEFKEKYQNLVSPIPITNEKIEGIMARHDINYTPRSAFQPYFYEAQEAVPVCGYYKIHVKIAHFGMTISAVRHDMLNIFEEEQFIKGTYGAIYFAQVAGSQVCFKSFGFTDEDSFQNIFKKVVKEYCIIRICSALSCSPLVQQNLGFDIIIYNNCIQYASERGSGLRELTQTDAKLLTEELALMHHLHIIHYDIKPENIVFSGALGKFVFIDFGLSEIIEEQIGFKTLGGFRGTPNYCSPEMFAQMMESQGYVDLYYNDAYSLSVSISQINKQYESEEISYPPVLFDSNKYPVFYLLAFKYHYLQELEWKCIEDIQLFLKYGGKITAILEFIKEVLPYSFLKNMFESNLKTYKSHALYQQIRHQLKLSAQRIFFRKKGKQEKQLQAPIAYIPLSYSGDQQIKAKDNQNHEHFVTLITSIECLQQKTLWSYLSIAFSCVRFDKNNLQIKEKHLIASKINFLLQTFEREEIQSIQQRTVIQEIQQFFLLMLRICLKSSINKWSKYNIFDICYQLILLDVDLNPLMKNILSFYDTNFTNELDSIIVILELTRLTQAISIIISSKMYQMDQLYNTLKAYIDKKLKLFQEPNCEHFDEEINSINKIIFFLKLNQINGEQKYVQKEYQRLKYIKNQKVRMYFKVAITLKSIEYMVDNSINDRLLKTAVMVKQWWQTKRLDFHSWTQITRRLLNTTYSHLDIPTYISQIAKIINCEEVFRRFSFQTLKMLDTFDENQFRQIIDRFTEEYPRMRSMSNLGDSKLFKLVLQVQSRQLQIGNTLRTQLLRLYKTYQSFNEQNKIGNCRQINFFYTILCRAELESFFYGLGAETRDVFLDNLRSSRQKYDHLKKILPTLVDQGLYEVPLSWFKYSVYCYKYYYVEQILSNCIQTLNELFKLALSLNIPFLALQFRKIQNIVCYKQKNIQLMILYSKKLLQYCRSIDYLCLYLQPSNANISFLTMAIFASVDSELFHSFLAQLADNLHGHAIDSYFAVLLLILGKFIFKYPSFGYLIHYSKFGGLNPKSLKNPYFLIFYAFSLRNEPDNMKPLLFPIFALNVDRISQFAKRKILQKYFAVYLCFIRETKKCHRFYAFRHAKVYLTDKNKLRQAKILLRTVKTKSTFLKKKFNKIVKSYKQHKQK